MHPFHSSMSPLGGSCFPDIVSVNRGFMGYCCRSGMWRSIVVFIQKNNSEQKGMKQVEVKVNFDIFANSFYKQSIISICALSCIPATNFLR